MRTRAGLDKYFAPTESRTPAFQPEAIPIEQSQPTYLAVKIVFNLTGSFAVQILL
jgi:hypothetical protein